MQKVEFATNRVILRAPDDGDIDAVTDACQDPGIQRWVPIPVPYARSDAEAFVHDYSDPGWASGTMCTWAIHSDGGFAGVISLDRIANGEATIGYWLRAQDRGRGLIVESALAAILPFAFAPAPDALGLERIEWHAYAGNLASARVASAMGFRFDRVVPLGADGRNGREDDWVAGLLRTDARVPVGWPVLPRTMRTAGDIVELLRPMFAEMLTPAELASLEFGVATWDQHVPPYVAHEVVINGFSTHHVHWRILGEEGGSGGIDPESDDRTLVRFVQSDLQDFVAESSFGWGQLRGPLDLL